MFEDEREIAALISEVSKPEGQKPRRHRYYKQTVKHAESMGVHVEGHNPKHLLDQKRPNEPDDIRDYRLSVWKNVTESLAGKVLHTISKIFDPKLFRIKFPENPSGLIPDEEELSYYLHNEFGIYKDLFVFVRETLLTKEMSDPNSLCLVIPENPFAEQNEFYRPVPKIFKAEYLVDFIEDKYYVLWIPHYKDKLKTKAGELWIITKEFVKYFKVDTDGKSTLKLELETGFLPAFRLGGVVKGDRNPYWFKSFIHGVQPHWDKVVTMVSDLDGSIVNHLFPTPWQYTEDCETCEGKGYVEQDIENSNGEKAKVKCRSCYGSGRMASKSPFGGYTVKRDAINPEIPSPIPPAGFITKDIEPIRELKTLKDEEILKGFEAINMEVVHRVGENQSGIAKTIDRADLDSMLMRIAQHVFECNIVPIVEYVARWRYGKIIDERTLNEYIEAIEISKPKDFSVIGANMLMEELKAASASNVSSNYIRNIESEIINNRFANNEPEKKKNLAIIKLKPFPGKTDDQIALGVANRTIKEKDAIRNANIDDLVTIAIEEDEGFLDKTFKEKLDAINAIIERDYIEDAPITIPVEE